ncbi:MAG: hypothetical protein WCT46_04770 [Candidatus Gracilibacteria bacterium]|jgi:hypothetical protein
MLKDLNKIGCPEILGLDDLEIRQLQCFMRWNSYPPTRETGGRESRTVIQWDSALDEKTMGREDQIIASYRLRSRNPSIELFLQQAGLGALGNATAPDNSSRPAI